ncbi:uncharacterized protein [Miscanthus floridulus]|uniref:uncharacterized protein n=1 Tax=Miscanthus floridulus TaxID=154761 RepID=UPI0034587F61
MRLDKASAEWQQGLTDYLDSTFGGSSKGGTAPCPCSACRSMSFRKRSDVQNHLLRKSFDGSFIREQESICERSAIDNDDDVDDRAGTTELLHSLIRGTIRGEIDEEQPNEMAKKFFKLLQEAKKELFPGCTEATQVSFIVKMFQMKCMFGCSNACMEYVLGLFLLILPKGHCLPDSMEKIKKVVRDLGLNYEKIDACYNDCVLFRGKEYEGLDNCPKCGETRWKQSKEVQDVGSSCGSKKRVPRKILRYFPLIPRLQRIYMSETRASYMRWHKEELVVDGKMQHAADSKAWKHVDASYEWFAEDPRNVRLGLASDGFNPFGARSPGVSIDVYLQPLIDELKVLWEEGVKAWDAKERKDFDLHAILLWTINDFPAYAMLSGWSTKGKFACPYCHMETDYLWLKHGKKHCYMGHHRFLPMDHKWRKNKVSFNNKTEYREAPQPLTREQVLQHYDSFDQVTFGPESRKRKQRDEEKRWHNWRKKSIFFQLPYWKKLLIRHNLDVMHIEKNICESILGTLLDIEGKSKDNEEARLDMQHLGIRMDQHPEHENGKFTLPPALYKLEKDDKKLLCKFLHEVKLPDGAHKASLKEYNPHNVKRKHKQQFVGWFEDKTKQEYDQGKASEEMYNLSQGPDDRAHVFNRCFINGFLFRTVSAEMSLITQNSGVLVKGDESTGNMDWYGVIKKIISLQFTGGKEVMMFQCDWFDVPAPTKNKGKGYNKDRYGIIDIDTTRLRYSDDPYIVATQAEQVFYVKHAKKSNWCSVVRIKPRNLFSMPESASVEEEAEIDVDSLLVGVEDMTVRSDQGDLMNWR